MAALRARLAGKLVQGEVLVLIDLLIDHPRLDDHHCHAVSGISLLKLDNFWHIFHRVTATGGYSYALQYDKCREGIVGSCQQLARHMI